MRRMALPSTASAPPPKQQLKQWIYHPSRESRLDPSCSTAFGMSKFLRSFIAYWMRWKIHHHFLLGWRFQCVAGAMWGSEPRETAFQKQLMLSLWLFTTAHPILRFNQSAIVCLDLLKHLVDLCLYSTGSMAYPVARTHQKVRKMVHSIFGHQDDATMDLWRDRTLNISQLIQFNII